MDPIAEEKPAEVPMRATHDGAVADRFSRYGAKPWIWTDRISISPLEMRGERSSMVQLMDIRVGRTLLCKPWIVCLDDSPSPCRSILFQVRPSTRAVCGRSVRRFGGWGDRVPVFPNPILGLPAPFPSPIELL